MTSRDVDIGTNVKPASSLVPSSSSSPFSRLLKKSKSISGRIESALHFDSSLYEGEIVFVIYTRISRYEILAFTRSLKRLPMFSFTINLSVTFLPFYCGFGAVGSTLYMIGGNTLSTTAEPEGQCSAYVSNLVTYKIDLQKIHKYPDNCLPSNLDGFILSGPSLHAKKQSPLVIVVGIKIYVFSRFLLADEETSNFECLDTGAEEWILLPEPPFQADFGIINFDYMEIVSHGVEGDFIVICISCQSSHGQSYHGVYRLGLHTDEWSFVNPHTLSFHGKGVRFENVYYAFMLPCDDPENTVGFFPSILSSEVQKVLGIEPPSNKVYWLHLSEFALIGDTFFIARTGYPSRPDPNSDDPDHYLTVDKFRVSMVAGKAKAVKSLQDTRKIEVKDYRLCGRSLYFASWVRKR